MAERYRGAPRLNINPDNGETLCIACNLCALACPETLIVVTSERNEETKPQGTHHLHLRHLALHVLRPVRGRLPGGRAGTDAGFRMASYTREGQIWDRQMLEEGPKPTQYKC